MVTALCMSVVAASPSGASAKTGGSSSLTIGLPSDPAPQGYDPLKYSSGQRLFYEALYNSLFVEGPKGQSEPSLAASYALSQGNTVATIQLEPGVAFSDGTPLDANAVVANLNRRGEAGLVAYTAFATGGASAITSVSATGADTVVITFASAQTSFASELTGEPGMIVNPNDFNSLGQAPAGSGPYVLKSAIRGSSYVLAKNPKAWHASQYSYQTITYKAITTAQALANAVVSGQVDIAALPDTSTVSFLKAQHVGLRSVRGAVVLFADWDINGLTAKPLGNLKVRQAFQLAINRNKLVDGLHPGDAATANAFPPGSEGYDPKLDAQWAYNPAKAKELLKQAGYPHGFTFSTVALPGSGLADEEAVANQLAAVGITMKIVTATSTAQLFAATNTEPLGYFSFTWPTDPIGGVTGVFVGGFGNPHHEMNAAVDSALTAAEGASGKAEVTALTQLNDALVDQGWLYPMYQQETYVAFNAHKVAPPTFPGSDPFPLLSTIKPA
jgi:peptide/nickel transport system substrate-binding protein